MSETSNPLFGKNEIQGWGSFEKGTDIALGLEQAWSGVIYTLMFVLIAIPLCYSLFVLASQLVIVQPSDLIVFAVFSLACSGIGAMVFPIVGSSIAIGMVVGVNWSFGDFMRQRTAVIIFGTLSGYLTTVWLLLMWGEFVLAGAFIASVAFVFSAMVAGYLGAILTTTRRGVWKRAEKEKHFQFEIKHVLVLTFWICLLLTFDRLVGNYKVLSLFGLYAFTQMGVLFFDSWIRKWRKLARFVPWLGKVVCP